MSPLPAGIWQKLCISASNLRHALINGTFSVLFKKRCRSVSSVISGSLFVCLFLYRFKKVHFRRGFSKVVINTHWSYRGVGSVLSPLLKRPKTESFCKLIKYAPILDTLQHRWATRKKKTKPLFSPAVFNYINIIAPSGLLVDKQKPITCSCRCEFPQGRKLQ